MRWFLIWITVERRALTDFLVCFFQACWDFIKDDVVESVRLSFRLRYISPGLNSTLLF